MSVYVAPPCSSFSTARRRPDNETFFTIENPEDSRIWQHLSERLSQDDNSDGSECSEVENKTSESMEIENEISESFLTSFFQLLRSYACCFS
mmetsp:Transcript_23667/g.42848  ORF Transcript_23667/g.42848 Transcript_23667/m.42848 type:complete len:92 (-) Transcript_23667:14-289(-)